MYDQKKLTTVYHQNKLTHSVSPKKN